MAQNQLISSIEYGNRSFDQRNFDATKAGNKLYIMSQWASFTADLSKSELGYIDQQYGITLKPESGPLFLLRNPFGLYKPTPSGLELIHSLDGEDSFPYSYAGTSSGDVSFFKYRNKELWVTNGTPEGTEMFREFEDPIQAIIIIEDTVHCIIESTETRHFAINRLDRGEVSSVIPGIVESDRLFSDEFLSLKNTSIIDDQYGWYFYSLINHSTKFVGLNTDTIPIVPASSMKAIDGYLYGSPSQASWMPPTSAYVYRIDIENDQFEMVYSSPDSIRLDGYRNIYNVSGHLVIIGKGGKEGDEIYRISDLHKIELVKDIYPGWVSSLVAGNTIEYKDQLYFAARSPYEGSELWRTDGTESGTRRVSDFEPGPGGVHWLSLFATEDNLYCMTRNRENILSLYAIDDAAEGFIDDSEPNDEMVWDRYFFRNGRSYESYMNPVREPFLVSTPSGFTGLLPSLNGNHPNYSDTFEEVDGDLNLVIPDEHWNYNANLVYLLNKEGLVDTAFFVFATGANCTMVVEPKTEEIFLTFAHEDSTLIGGNRIDADGSATGIAKFNPKGELLWYKLYNKNGSLFIHGMDISSDKLFISGYYSGAYLNLGNGITLNSIYNQQYFTAAFDLNGDAIWAVNTSMEGLQKYSTLGQIHADEKNEIVYVASSEHTLNTWSSCGYGEWKSRIVALKTTSGKEVWMEDLICDDFLRLRDISTDAIGNLWLAGNFRGNLTIGNRMLHADGDNDCPTNAFVALLDGRTRNEIYSFSTPEIHKRSRKILARDGFVDVVYLNAFWEPDDALQPMAHQRVSYLEKETYTLTGKWVGTERFPTPMGVYLGGYSNDDNAGIKATICAVGESHYALQLAYFGGGVLGLGTRRAPPLIGWKSSTTTIQRTHPKFQLPEDFSEEPFVNVGFSIYPNPVSNGQVSVVIDPDRLGDFDTMTFTDIQGRVVWNVKLDTRYYSMRYTIPPFLSGIYIVTLRGDNTSGSQRLLILK